MRKPFMAGNWKMYKTIDEAVALVEQQGPLSEIDSVTSGVCPPFVAIPAVREVLRGTNIKVGAQNMFWEDEGAYTGEFPRDAQGHCRHGDHRALGAAAILRRDGRPSARSSRRLKHGSLPIVAVGEP